MDVAYLALAVVAVAVGWWSRPSSAGRRVEPERRPACVFKCPVCLDDSEGSGVAASVGARRCSHEVCSPCFASYAEHSVVHSRSSVVSCVARGCAAKYTFDSVAAALAGRPAALSILYDLAAHVAAGQLIYCPHPGCGEPLSLPDGGAPVRQPSECLRCHRALCASCVGPWHANLTCAAFKALPEAQRLPASEVALRDTARREGWRPCPDCGTMIEKHPDGCAFIACRCGCGFCYKCGVKYLGREAVRMNVHGQTPDPACKFSSFFPTGCKFLPLLGPTSASPLANHTNVSWRTRSASRGVCGLRLHTPRCHAPSVWTCSQTRAPCRVATCSAAPAWPASSSAAAPARRAAHQLRRASQPRGCPSRGLCRAW